MASLQITGVTGEQAAAVLHEAAVICGQRGNRNVDLTIDLTTGTFTTTDNRPDSGKTGKKN